MRTPWVILFLFLHTSLFAQSPSSSFLVAWWDVEALFDTKPDTTTDVDFTPSGKYQWTPEKLNLKFQRLAQTIQDLAHSRGFALPDIMGFCNIEHQWLLDTLFQKYLRTNDFQTVFFASPSSASRNLGLVFNRRKFSLNYSNTYPIALDTGKSSMPDIMLVKLDTLYCFQFLGIPPKGEQLPGKTGKLHKLLFPISRDPPEGGTRPPPPSCPFLFLEVSNF